MINSYNSNLNNANLKENIKNIKGINLTNFANVSTTQDLIHFYQKTTILEDLTVDLNSIKVLFLDIK